MSSLKRSTTKYVTQTRGNPRVERAYGVVPRDVIAVRDKRPSCCHFWIESIPVEQSEVQTESSSSLLTNITKCKHPTADSLCAETMDGPGNALSYEETERMAELLMKRTKHRPTIGIICGSGLSSLADLVEESDRIPYSEIPNFPCGTVKGHSGQLVFGKLSGRTVVCMQGRIHPYEGHPMWKCAMPVRLMKLCGIKYLVVTNAAGGLNPNFNNGDIMIIKDHINFPGLSGNHPLRGVNDERWGPRFPALNGAYSVDLIDLVRKVALEVGAGDFLREGVYCMLGGPNYETVAEVKMLQLLGGDCAGMSTCHEVIVAKHCGLRVIGLSLITNKAVSDYAVQEYADHDEVLATASQRSKVLERIVSGVVAELE